MKLTKGKISKLYKKNRQTARKIKKRKGSLKSKTFRRKRNINLANKSLKKMRRYRKQKGGEADQEIPKVDDMQTTSSPVEAPVVEAPVVEAPVEEIPVEAPEGTAARKSFPSEVITSASTVGLPLESIISRARILLIVAKLRAECYVRLRRFLASINFKIQYYR